MKAANTIRGGAAALMLASAPLSAQSVCDLVVGNLVTNCGFELLSFTGWTPLLDAGNQININTDVPHSGRVAAAFVNTSTPSFIEQVIGTTPGTAYEVSFWFQNPAFGVSQPGGQFTFDWGGVNRLTLINPAASPYAQYTYVFVANAATIALRFGGFEGQTTFPILDDVVVRATTVPEPATLLLTGAGLACLLLRRRRVRDCRA